MKKLFLTVSTICITLVSGITLAEDVAQTDMSNQQYCEQQAELAGYIDRREIQDMVTSCLEDLKQVNDIQTTMGVDDSQDTTQPN